MPTLEWIGKAAVVNHHRDVPFRLLKENKALTVGGSNSGNVLVQGDNLIALKALLPYYAGKVKCIYIDPPYNTGNEKWAYNDNVNSLEIKEWLGKVVGKEGDDLSRHDKWLCMMYPRLRLLKEFLQQDGVILISIDDNELASLKLLIAELFGEGNVLATLVWEKGKKGDSKFFSVTHEYIVVVAKNKSTLVKNDIKWRKRKEGIEKALDYYQSLRNQGLDHETIHKEMMKWYRSLPKGDPSKNHKHYKWSDDRGLYFAADFSGPDDGRDSRPRYDILHPVTGKPCRIPSTGWRWDPETTIQALNENPQRIHFGKDEKTIPCRKSYLFEIDEEPFTSVFYKDGRAATIAVENILGPGAFPFPKDVDVLVDLIGMICEKGDIILDSFAGSGTTAEVVLRLNHSDSGKRKFVLIELERDICREKTKKRIQSIISGYSIEGKKGNTIQVPGLGGGFTYYELGDTILNEDGFLNPDIMVQDLARFVFYLATESPMSEWREDTPFLGSSNGIGVYLMHPSIQQGQGDDVSVLTKESLEGLPPFDGPRIIYADSCLLTDEQLRKLQITFKQIPYSLEVS